MLIQHLLYEISSFLIHLGLSEPSAAYKMKRSLVWFADLSYSFCQHLKSVFSIITQKHRREHMVIVHAAIRVRFWAVQNLFWAGRCPKLGLNPPFTAQNCPKLPKTAQNCLKLPTDYESTKFILGQISNLLSLSFLMLENIN